MTSLLIVDDSKAARMMLKHWLKAIRPKIETVEAGSGEEAVPLISSLSPDSFAILDYNMPGMNGIDLAKKVLSIVPPGRVALCTANIQETIQRRALDLGIVYVSKPLNAGKVHEVLCKMEKNT